MYRITRSPNNGIVVYKDDKVVPGINYLEITLKANSKPDSEIVLLAYTDGSGETLNTIRDDVVFDITGNGGYSIKGSGYKAHIEYMGNLLGRVAECAFKVEANSPFAELTLKITETIHNKDESIQVS